MTDFKPFSTRGERNPESLFNPHRFCPGNETISTYDRGKEREGEGDGDMLSKPK